MGSWCKYTKSPKIAWENDTNVKLKVFAGVNTTYSKVKQSQPWQWPPPRRKLGFSSQNMARLSHFKKSFWRLLITEWLVDILDGDDWLLWFSLVLIGCRDYLTWIVSLKDVGTVRVTVVVWILGVVEFNRLMSFKPATLFASTFRRLQMLTWCTVITELKRDTEELPAWLLKWRSIAFCKGRLTSSNQVMSVQSFGWSVQHHGAHRSFTPTHREKKREETAQKRHWRRRLTSDLHRRHAKYPQCRDFICDGDRRGSDSVRPTNRHLLFFVTII